MKLQIAADKGSVEDILRTAEKVHDVVDIFEVGTPVIMNLGMEPVRQLKKLYPDMTVLADSKIVDAGAFEAEEIFRSGADIATVLAVSDGESLKVGTPYVEGAKVVLAVDGVVKGKKVINFKAKRRKGSRRLVGHRQQLTVATVKEIA